MTIDYESQLPDYSQYLKDSVDIDYNFVAPSSVFNSTSQPQNIFTGLSSYGYNAMYDRYKDIVELDTLKEGFDATVDYYTKEAVRNKRLVELQTEDALNSALVSNEVARQTNLDIVRQEGGTLGTGAKQTMLDNISQQYKNQAISINTEAKEKLLEAWATIDSGVAEVLQLNAQQYTEFIQTTESLTTDFLQNLYENNWLGINFNVEEGVPWYTALSNAGLGTYNADGSFELSAYGQAVIRNAFLGDAANNTLAASAKNWLENSEYKDWYNKNSAFWLKEILGIDPSDMPTSEDLSKLYVESGYTASNISPVSEDDLGRDKFNKSDNKYIKAVRDVIGDQSGKAVTVSSVALGDILTSAIRDAMSSGDLRVGSMIELDINTLLANNSVKDVAEQLGIRKTDIKQAKKNDGKLIMFYGGDGVFVHVESINPSYSGFAYLFGSPYDPAAGYNKNSYIYESTDKPGTYITSNKYVSMGNTILSNGKTYRRVADDTIDLEANKAAALKEYSDYYNKQRGK